MNQDRRKTLKKLGERIGKLQQLLANDVVGELESIADDIGSAQDEEQEFLDNMPESLQGGERGEAAQIAIDEMEAAKDTLMELKDALDEKLDEAASSLEEAAGV